jgi:hypothetical protein|tara:strand:+ start:4324 stop:4746 length:423 start_codon:yes stop_codon:yes gene_type:complete
MFCRQHIAQLRDYEPQIVEAGGRVAAVGLGDINYARDFRDQTGISFPLLVDEKRMAYNAADLKHATLLHLFRRQNFRDRNVAQAQGHRQYKVGRNPFQLGGGFIIAPGNVDLFAYASETFGDNAPVNEMLDVFRKHSELM